MSLITVVVADDIVNTREDVKRLLFFEEDIKVIGEAGDGEEAIRVVQELKPDVVLMDINMPGLDGISATEKITETVPQTAVIIISVQGEHEYLRKAMAAGASDYLIKPFTSQELADTIRRVYEKAKKRQDTLLRLQQAPEEAVPGQIVVFFGSKGGAGRSTLCCNLAVALSQEFKQRVTVVDLDIAAGDVAALFNLSLPGSIAELVRESEINEEIIKSYEVTHLTGCGSSGPSRRERRILRRWRPASRLF
ncbi:response regulator [Thermodesulfitimonas sp.]